MLFQGDLFNQEVYVPTYCEKCPLHPSKKEGKNRVCVFKPSIVNQKYKTAVILSTLTQGEWLDHRIRQYIQKDYPDALVLPSVMCLQKYPDEKIPQKAMSCCGAFINDIIRDTPNIVLSGTESVRSFLGSIGGEKSNYGRIIQKNGKNFIISLNYKNLTHSPELRMIWKTKNPDKLKPITPEWKEIDSDEVFIKNIGALFNDLSSSSEVYLDIETNGLLDTLYGIPIEDNSNNLTLFETKDESPRITAIGVGTDSSIYIFPVNHHDKKYNGNMIITSLIPLLSSLTPVGANIGFDLQWLNKLMNLPFPEKARDVLLEYYLLYQVTHQGGLKEIVQREFYYPEWEDLQGYTYKNIPWDKLSLYLAHDINATRMLAQSTKRRLSNHPVNDFYWDTLVKATPVYAEMQASGVKMRSPDIDKFDNMLSDMEKSLMSHAKKAGYKRPTLNLNSSRDLIEVLIKKEKREVLEVTDKGHPKIDKDVLKQYSNQGSVFAKTLLNYRELYKIRNTYLTVPSSNTDKSMVVHPNIFLNRTATGRTASSGPNLQNIPGGKSEIAKAAKGMFVSKYKHGCISETDYSQAELRCLAMVSNDSFMVKEYLKQMTDCDYEPDLHIMAVEKALHMTKEDISKELRNGVGKVLNFGIIYGMSKYGLVYLLRDFIIHDIPVRIRHFPKKLANALADKCQDIIDNYLNGFPGIKKYVNDHQEFAKKHGYIVTPTGRVRLIPGARNEDSILHKSAMNKAINTPIQAVASDMKIKALVKLMKAKKEYDMPFDIILEVHDSILLDHYHVKYALENIQFAEKIIASSYFTDSPVPLLCDSKWGPSWGETIPIEPKRCWKCSNMVNGSCIAGETTITKDRMQKQLEEELHYILCPNFKKN